MSEMLSVVSGDAPDLSKQALCYIITFSCLLTFILKEVRFLNQLYIVFVSSMMWFVPPL